MYTFQVFKACVGEIIFLILISCVFTDRHRHFAWSYCPYLQGELIMSC